jgi:hypothetical protein
MIVSLTKKFIFVHIPKNAGTSIQAALLHYRVRFLTRGRGKHETLVSFHRRTLGVMRCFRSFAVVRNPWDRAHSGYRYLLTRPDRAGMPNRIRTFDDYLSDLETNPEWLHPIRTVRPQLSFVSDRDGKLLTTRLLRYETITADFSSLCADWGLSGELPHVNKGAFQGVSYREAYSSQGFDIVARLYALDIERFSYDF